MRCVWLGTEVEMLLMTATRGCHQLLSIWHIPKQTTCILLLLQTCEGSAATMDMLSAPASRCRRFARGIYSPCTSWATGERSLPAGLGVLHAEPLQRVGAVLADGICQHLRHCRHLIL